MLSKTCSRLSVRPAVFVTVGFLAVACGLSTNTLVPPNDSAPDGTIVAQGSFTSLNGKTVTGAASVYRAPAGNYVIRLQGISAPSETNLLVIGTANGTEVVQTTLRSSVGTQNYVTTVTDSSLVWNSITIRSPSNATTPDYGTAILTH